MRKFFLTTTTLLLWISHAGFAINTNTAATKPLSKLTKSTKPHITIHTTTKGITAKKTNVTLKKTTTKNKNTTRKVQQISTKSSKKLHNKKSTKTATRHYNRHTTPQVKSLNLQSERNDIAAITDLAVTDTPTSIQQTQENSSVKKTGFHLFGWGKNNTSQQQVTAFAHKTVATLHYSAYKFGGNRFDLQHGVYMLDCSGYVDNLLDKTSPQAYSTLAQWSGSYKPNSEHYYNFFNRLANDDGYDSWDAVENTHKLQPGDILVFRYKNARGKSRGGHVMLVMDKPVGNSGVVRVRVADSAETGHSADTRGSHSGVGIGTLLLKVNPSTGKPYAFAWRVDSPWNTRVNIAMGRPADDDA